MHHVPERDWTTCFQYVYHSKLNSQHNWLGTYVTINEHKDLHFDNE